LAAEFGNVSTIKTLVEIGADIDVTCRCHWSAVYYAVCGGNLNNVIRELFLLGANFDIQDGREHTPLSEKLLPKTR
jgi:hypothetical protein